jgi:hypothetical protein
MKNLLIIVLMLVIISTNTIGQFKSRPETTPSVSESLIRPDGGGLLFGWFNPSRLTINNSYTLSYTTSGRQGFSLGTLTSSLAYQISNPLSIEFDLSLMHSPFNNLGGNFAKNISGFYLTRAELNYKPSKDILFQVQFRQLPALYWLNNYDRLDYMPTFNRIEEEEGH